MTLKFTASAALCALIGLSACNDPSQLGLDNTAKTEQGALFGGILGAGIGALVSDDKAKGALIGGALGALGGGVVGKQLQRQEEELRAQLASDEITIVNTGDRLIVSLPHDITFDSDSSTVRSALRFDLNTVASNLQRYPNSTVQIIGHTDSDGEAAYNAKLSQQRASSVSQVLSGGGVALERLQISGRGEEQPLASNLTEEGKAKNRRVEIVVIPQNS
ncbi:MAG: OmpA family protein [Rhodobacteraceae bacterium]|nr:OmpA family protein [Paracoccaceae bacterium]